MFIGKQDKKSSIIALRVNSENELFSKYFAEVLSKEVSEFYVETKTKLEVYLELKNVTFGGRLSEYRYYDMHQVIGSAMKTFKMM